MVKLAGYRVLREIGRGGMATVYLARQQSLHRRVALKILRPQLARDETFVRRFLREGRTAARLHHRNIVAIHDIGSHQGVVYMALEYLPGGSLAPFVGKLSAADVLRCVREVGEALAAAHAEGIVHRDVKPGNILRHEDGSFLLSDFGVAWHADSNTQPSDDGAGTNGTPAYMSPERWRGLAIDGRADIYSLGIVLYQLCSGRLPYAGGDGWSIGMQHMTSPLPQLPATHAALQPLLNRMLAKEPELRFAGGGELATAVRELERRGVAGDVDDVVLRAADPAVAASAAIAAGPARSVPAPATATAPAASMAPALAGMACATASGGTTAGDPHASSLPGSTRSRFLRELRERRVPQAALGYIAISWVLLQAGDVMFDALGMPDWSLRLMLTMLMLGFPVAVAMSWYFNFTTDGIKRELADVIGSGRSDPHLAAVLMLEPCNGGSAVTPRVRRLLEDYHCIQREVEGEAIAAEFRTAREALACALTALREEGLGLRAGLALGEVGRDFGHMTGDGMREVQLFAHLADPGGLAVSNGVHEALIARAYPRLAASMRAAPASSGHGGRRPMLATAELLASTDLPESAAPSVSPHSAHGIAFTTFAASAVLVLGLVAVLWFAPLVGTGAPAEGSIVVMPFQIQGGTDADRDFADGLTDEMQDALSAVTGLRVAARSSAIAVAEQKLDALAIGERLKVAHLLTASVRRADQRLRISVRLARTDDGFDIWNESFDQRSADVFRMQQEIAEAVVGRVLGVLPEGVARLERRLQPTTDIGAYEAYLRGRATLNRSSSIARLSDAIADFRTALAADAGFARARAGICTAEVRRHEQLRDSEALQRATEACREAAAMDPALREVSLALGELERARGRQEEARGHYARSLDDVTLRADAYIGLARVEAAGNQPALARAYFERAALAEPDYWRVHYATGNFRFHQGDRAGAIAAYRRAIALAPDDAVSPWNNLGAVLLSQDDFEGAADAFRRSVAIDPSHSALSNLGLVQFHLGDHAAAADLFERATALVPTDFLLWGNLGDARAIFRKVMLDGYGTRSDWKYMLPAWLPISWHAWLIRRLGR